MIRELGDAGVSTSIHFRPLHDFEWMRRNAEIGAAGLGTAEALADRVFSLPLYPDLTDEMVEEVCEAVGKALPRCRG
jgi:dTDP-4-amino-4,6-dideoxygalactose transaminase